MPEHLAAAEPALELPDLTCLCGHQPEKHVKGMRNGPGMCLVDGCPCGAYYAAADTEVAA